MAGASSAAPLFKVAPREVFAVEHPMIVMNLDNGLKTFGTNGPFKRILESDGPDDCIPLYLRPHDPMCVPILSHNSQTNNLLLKITVPKRTSRKRKRGSQDPYTDSLVEYPTIPEVGKDSAQQDNLRSQARKDNPAELLRTLKDNADRYSVEAVGEVGQTHRFRGLTDFHQSTANTPFFSKLRDTALTGHIEKIRDFKFDLSRGWKPNEEIMPPPSYTNHTLPFNWGWHQNPSITVDIDQATGKSLLVNRARRSKLDLKYLPHDATSIPQGPPFEPPDDPVLLGLIQALDEALDERPVWTRRALTNRVSGNPGVWLIRNGLQFVGYQFKGGPFRDAIIKFGIDPRTDKKYRFYQTLFFKLYEEEDKVPGMPWHDVRTGYTLTKRASKKRVGFQTHIFDGKSLTLDGKIWQLCDITDPFIARLINNSPLRETFDSETDGWFCNGAWSKIKTIMKTKLIAIRAQKTVRDEDFKEALDCPDIVPGKRSRNIYVPVPDLRLSDSEIQSMRDRGMMNSLRGSGLRKRDQKARSRRIRPRVGDGPLKKRLGGGRRRNHIPIRALPSEIWPEVGAGNSNKLADLGMAGPESETGRSGTNDAQSLGPADDGEMGIDDEIEDDDEEEDGEESDELDEGIEDEGGEEESESGEEEYDSEATDTVDFATQYRTHTAQ